MANEGEVVDVSAAAVAPPAQEAPRVPGFRRVNRDLIEVDLEYPVGDNGAIDTIKLRRPRGADIKVVGVINGGLTTRQFLDLAAQISGQLSIVFDELDGADSLNVIEAVSSFLQSGRAASRTGGDRS